MHIVLRLALCVASAWTMLVLSHAPGNAWPAHRSINIERASLQLVGDKCWWWGTRWQFGWRGYGWYACWDEVKPSAPVVIAPEAVPESAALPDSCLRTWRDKSGNLHSRRIC